MEIWEVKNIGCGTKENRQKLMRATMEVLRLDEKPTIEYMGKCIRSLEKKYGFSLSHFSNLGGTKIIQVNIMLPRSRSYSVFQANSFYEMCCKYILIMKEYVEYYVRVDNFK